MKNDYLCARKDGAPDVVTLGSYTHSFANFSRADLAALNKDKEEEGVFGYIETKDESGKTFTIDVKYESKDWNGRRDGICLEVYEERDTTDAGMHGCWVASIYDFATNHKIFSPLYFQGFIRRRKNEID